MAGRSSKAFDGKQGAQRPFKISATYKKRVGRPLALESPEELEDGVCIYFEKCNEERIPATMPGLTCHLGVAQRTLQDFADREGYDEILVFAKQLIEHQRNLMLFDKDTPTAGVIFDLVNNYGWVNSQRNEHSGLGGGAIQANVTSIPMPADVQNELDAHKEELAGE